jgi:hypothetical protein
MTLEAKHVPVTFQREILPPEFVYMPLRHAEWNVFATGTIAGCISLCLDQGDCVVAPNLCGAPLKGARLMRLSLEAAWAAH